ncbi:hypothetical protein FACS189472_04300 [Alphaproteobacteria bacterium]|nr:hypothetical protein FACS189472_04300 [Alphaproteobacteria bacterium]
MVGEWVEKDLKSYYRITIAIAETFLCYAHIAEKEVSIKY